MQSDWRSIRARNDMLVLEIHPDADEENGIITSLRNHPGHERPELLQATVHSVGPKVREVAVGDRVLINRGDGHLIQRTPEEVVIAHEWQIEGKVLDGKQSS